MGTAGREARRLAFLVLAVAGMPAAAGAQELARRVEDEGDATVRFAYAAREGVEICDQGIRMGGRRMMWHSSGYRGWRDEATGCRYGPVEVELEVREGSVADLDLPFPRSRRAAQAVELGEVSAAEAAAYLAELARGRGSERAARDAVFALVLADMPEVWRELMALARDRALAPGMREHALFWLGQEAAEAATVGLAAVARDEDEEQEVRDAAVFALSQRPSQEGVPILMDVARTARHAKTRRSAMFWLAQSDDPRVLAFFEEILVGGRGG